jgi:hypothetical protein
VLAKLGKYEGLGKRFQATEMIRKLAAAKRGFKPEKMKERGQ